MNKISQHSSKNSTSSGSTPTPGRMTLDELHQEQLELKEAKKITSGIKPSQRLFGAVSMYSVAVDFGMIISLPLVAGVLIGRYLDTKYNTKYFVIIGILSALTISVVGLTKQIIKLKEKYKK